MVVYLLLAILFIRRTKKFSNQTGTWNNAKQIKRLERYRKDASYLHTEKPKNTKKSTRKFIFENWIENSQKFQLSLIFSYFKLFVVQEKQKRLHFYSGSIRISFPCLFFFKKRHVIHLHQCTSVSHLLAVKYSIIHHIKNYNKILIAKKKETNFPGNWKKCPAAPFFSAQRWFRCAEKIGMNCKRCRNQYDLFVSSIKFQVMLYLLPSTIPVLFSFIDDSMKNAINKTHFDFRINLFLIVLRFHGKVILLALDRTVWLNLPSLKTTIVRLATWSFYLLFLSQLIWRILIINDEQL